MPELRQYPFPISWLVAAIIISIVAIYYGVKIAVAIRTGQPWRGDVVISLLGCLAIAGIIFGGCKIIKGF